MPLWSSGLCGLSILPYCHSAKWGSVDSWRSPRSDYFHNNTKMSFGIYYCGNIYTDGAKAMLLLLKKNTNIWKNKPVLISNVVNIGSYNPYKQKFFVVLNNFHESLFPVAPNAKLTFWYFMERIQSLYYVFYYSYRYYCVTFCFFVYLFTTYFQRNVKHVSWHFLSSVQ